jgi:DnaJ-class molecular chaperone
VKKSYHKALVIIHPDKVRQKFGGDMDKVFVADKVFDQVRDAYKAFSEKEL